MINIHSFSSGPSGCNQRTNGQRGAESGGICFFFSLGSVANWNFHFDHYAAMDAICCVSADLSSDGEGRPCNTIHPDRIFVYAASPQTSVNFHYFPDRLHDALITRAEIASSPMTARVFSFDDRADLKRAALKLEMAHRYVNSRAGLAFVDASKVDQFEDATEQQEMIRDEFLAMLEMVTGMDPKYLARLLQSK